ncbi:MAG: hypothetical protein WCA53_21810, partial [Caballeronia sp.]
MSFSPSSTVAEASAADAAPLEGISSALGTDRSGSFAGLGSAFLTRLPATPLPEPYLVGISADTAA